MGSCDAGNGWVACSNITNTKPLECLRMNFLTERASAGTVTGLQVLNTSQVTLTITANPDMANKMAILSITNLSGQSITTAIAVR